MKSEKVTAEDYIKKGIKRKCIASMIVGLESNETAFYTPVITWYFDFTNLNKPIHLIIKYGWSAPEQRFPLNDRMKKIIESKLLATSLFYLSELLPEYKGKKNVTNYYKSEFGKDLPFTTIINMP